MKAHIKCYLKTSPKKIKEQWKCISRLLLHDFFWSLLSLIMSGVCKFSLGLVFFCLSFFFTNLFDTSKVANKDYSERSWITVNVAQIHAVFYKSFPESEEGDCHKWRTLLLLHCQETIKNLQIFHTLLTGLGTLLIDKYEWSLNLST